MSEDRTRILAKILWQACKGLVALLEKEYGFKNSKERQELGFAPKNY